MIKGRRRVPAVQTRQNNPRRIDTAVAAVMAHNLACYLAEISDSQLFVFG